MNYEITPATAGSTKIRNYGVPQRLAGVGAAAVKNGSKKGSSLLVAVLVMGVLITLTLGLSTLVVREINQTNDLVFAGKAYYNAEAGVENALLDLQEHLPGYEKDCKNSDKNVRANSDSGFTYKICNQGNSYPYFQKDQPVFLNAGVGITRDALYEQNAESTYNVLPLNKTVTIPLFVEKDGAVNNVHKFLLQYYVNFDVDPTNDVQALKNIKIEDFDVLRWKIFGQNQSDAGKTESISDFFPAYSTDSAITPVCIGSDSALITANPGQYSCVLPVMSIANENVDASLPVSWDISNSWSQARECYLNDSGIAIGGDNGTGVAKNCSIESFVNNHDKNYLTLTNVVNPDIVGINDPEIRQQKANIYYRIIAKNDDDVAGSGADPEKVLPREYANISADGFADNNKVKQSIDVEFKLNSFLPVFNFSLYRTDTGAGN